MSAAVSFDYGLWVARYPEFKAVGAPTAAAYFAEAGLYWRNDGTSPNASTATQTLFLNMITAHVAAIYAQAQGSAQPGAPQDPNTPVGRVTQAAVGSVNVSVDTGLVPSTSELQAYFSQTKYGLSFLSASVGYRRGGRYFIGWGPSAGVIPWNNGAW